MSNKPFPKIEITFAPAWWHHHYGMDFSERRAWQDPILATERDREQRRLLYERFGELGLGEADPKPNPVTGGEYGHRFMSAFWGCEVVYFPDQWPHAVPLPDAWERMDSLEVPAIETSAAAQLLFRNARLLNERYGACRAEINYGGPLNNAVSVLGEEIFVACAADPERARHVLRQMGAAILRVFDQVQSPINRVEVAQGRAGGWGIGNCPVGQISPRTYAEVVLPVDRWLLDHFQGDFLLHHCGLFHPYVEVYRPLNPAELDVGPGTDLRLTRQAYPRARLSAYLEVGALARMSRAEIDAQVARMIADASPIELFTIIRVAEAGVEISDQTVSDLLTVSERLRL